MSTVIFDATTSSADLDSLKSYFHNDVSVRLIRARYVVTIPRELKPADTVYMYDHGLIAHARLYLTSATGRVVWESGPERASELIRRSGPARESGARSGTEEVSRLSLDSNPRPRSGPEWEKCEALEKSILRITEPRREGLLQYIRDCFRPRSTMDRQPSEPLQPSELPSELPSEPIVQLRKGQTWRYSGMV